MRACLVADSGMLRSSDGVKVKRRAHLVQYIVRMEVQRLNNDFICRDGGALEQGLEL